MTAPTPPAAIEALRESVAGMVNGCTGQFDAQETAREVVALVLRWAAEQCEISKPLLNMGGTNEIAIAKTEMRMLAEKFLALAAAGGENR
jgi:hypothetical protein